MKNIFRPQLLRSIRSFSVIVTAILAAAGISAAITLAATGMTILAFLVLGIGLTAIAVVSAVTQQQRSAQAATSLRNHDASLDGLRNTVERHAKEISALKSAATAFESRITQRVTASHEEAASLAQKFHQHVGQISTETSRLQRRLRALDHRDQLDDLAHQFDRNVEQSEMNASRRHSAMSKLIKSTENSPRHSDQLSAIEARLDALADVHKDNPAPAHGAGATERDIELLLAQLLAASQRGIE